MNYGSYGASIPVPAGVATIMFDNDGIAAQQDGSRRWKGKFMTYTEALTVPAHCEPGRGASLASLMLWN